MKRIILLSVVMLALLAGCIEEGPENVYEDYNFRVVFPDWSEGPISQENDFFIMNSEEGRSYALNLYDTTDARSPEEIIDGAGLACLIEDGCEVSDLFTEGLFEVVCETYEDPDLGEVAYCAAAGVCGDSGAVISVMQELATMELPMDEYRGILSSTECMAGTGV